MIIVSAGSSSSSFVIVAVIVAEVVAPSSVKLVADIMKSNHVAVPERTISPLTVPSGAVLYTVMSYVPTSSVTESADLVNFT